MTTIWQYIWPALTDALSDMIPVILGATLLGSIAALMVFKVVTIRRLGGRRLARCRAMHALRFAAVVHARPARRGTSSTPTPRRLEIAPPRTRHARGHNNRWRRGALIVAGSVAISCCLAQESTPPTAPAGSPADETLATLRPGISSRTLRVSSDGRRIAYMATLEGGGEAVFVNNRQSPKYGGIVEGSLSFSPDSKRVAWGALRDGEKVVVVDGKEFPAFDGSAEGMPVWSSDSKRFAYFAATKNGKLLAVVDGMAGSPWDSVIKESFVFSPDSSRFAFVAKDGTDGRVVVDGNPGRPFQNIAGLAFSSDGKHFAYVGMSAQSMAIIVDGVERVNARAFIKGSLHFDGSQALHAVWLDGNQLVRVQIDLEEAVAAGPSDAKP